MGMLVMAAAVVGVQAQDYAYRPMEIQLAEGVNIEEVKDAGNTAIAEVITKFVEEKSGEELKQFQVLPFPEDVDGAYFSMTLQNKFASEGKKAGYERYTRSQQVFNQILKEIKWGDELGDVMNEATVQKFGRLEGVQGLIVPRLSLTTIDGVTTVRVMLQGYVVETGKALPFSHEGKQQIVPPEPPEPPKPFPWLIVACVVGGLIVLIVIVKAVKGAMRPR